MLHVPRDAPGAGVYHQWNQGHREQAPCLGGGRVLVAKGECRSLIRPDAIGSCSRQVLRGKRSTCRWVKFPPEQFAGSCCAYVSAKGCRRGDQSSPVNRTSEQSSGTSTRTLHPELCVARSRQGGWRRRVSTHSNAPPCQVRSSCVSEGRELLRNRAPGFRGQHEEPLNSGPRCAKRRPPPTQDGPRERTWTILSLRTRQWSQSAPVAQSRRASSLRSTERTTTSQVAYRAWKVVAHRRHLQQATTSKQPARFPIPQVVCAR